MKNKTLKRITTLFTALALTVATLTVPTTDVKAADEAGIRGFVTRMYDVCLGRTPDEAGLNDWCGQLARGEAEGADIAFGFVFSQEFQNMNLCNEHYVDAMYDAFFGRVPDEAGKADWLNALNTGKTRGYVLTGFVNSQEFHNLCNSFGITQGSGDWSNDNIPVNGTCTVCTNGNHREPTAEMRAFAERLYTCCLERTPETWEVDEWAQALANGATGSEVASGFVFSDEYKLKNAPNKQYVLMLYRTMLGREADATGVTSWVTQLNNGTSREAVFNGFLGSSEFANLCNVAGIRVGNPIEDNGTTGPASDNSTSSADQALIDQGFVPFDPSTNPEDDSPSFGGIVFN